ncbi:hypothetical protein BDV29DRAFT_164154 [Aspergillus leporis]|uniref:Uncharacterized protein n=1 Tax=Aspergillus leporis TaxID=41062 RepID=A0A5N5XG11_9EURO|nr:hypothetical protein BDV29DRAFT_164154 [Aspergillus leporis]
MRGLFNMGPVLTVIVYLIGKCSLMPLRGVVERNSSGCCSQVLAFPRLQIHMSFLSIFRIEDMGSLIP